jgi:hypothetical protein
MFGEASLFISIASLILSVVALLRRGRAGVLGPHGLAGQQGGLGPRGVPGPQATPQLGVEHAVCGQCGKTVARYSLTPSGITCANCSPAI